MKNYLQFLLVMIFSLIILLFPLFTLYAGKTSSQREANNKLNQYIEEGKVLYTDEDYQGALEKWTEALKIDPWNDEVKKLIDDALKRINDFFEEFDRGFKYLNSGNLDKARLIFNKLLKEVKPEDKKNYELLQKGIAILEEKEKEGDFKILIEEGDRYLKRRQIEMAGQVYEEAKRLFPGDSRLITRFEKINKIKKELRQIEEIAKLRKKAGTLFDQDQLQESRNIWEDVLKFVPNDEEAVLYISKIDFKKKEKERILALGKSYFEAGLRLFNRKKYPEAIDQFENTIAVNYKPDDAKNYIDKIKSILVDVERKKNEKMLEDVAKYLKNGIILFNLNKFKEALKALNEGLRLDPDNGQIKEYIVIVSIALKRQEEKSVDRGSQFYPLVENIKRLGKNAYTNGDYLSAIKYWEEILLIFPFNEDAKINLTKTLKKTDPKLASDILNNMLKEVKELLGSGEKREAMEKLKTILDVDSNNRNARYLYVKVKAELEARKIVVTKKMIYQAKELYTRGLEYYQNEDLKNAINIWRKALSIYPNFVEVRVSLAKAETKMRNLELIESGKEKQQVNDEAVSIKVKRHYIDGLNYYIGGLYKEAISEWEELLGLNPKDEQLKKKIKQNILKAKQRVEMKG